MKKALIITAIVVVLLVIVVIRCFNMVIEEATGQREYRQQTQGLPVYVLKDGVLNIDGVGYTLSNWSYKGEEAEKPFCIVDDQDNTYYKMMAFFYKQNNEKMFVEYWYEWDYGSGYVWTQLAREDIAQQKLTIQDVERIELVVQKAEVIAKKDEKESYKCFEDIEIVEEFLSIIYDDNSIVDVDYGEGVLTGNIKTNIFDNGLYWSAFLIYDGDNAYIETYERDEVLFHIVPKDSPIFMFLEDSNIKLSE